MCGTIFLHGTQKHVHHNHLFNVKMHLPTLVSMSDTEYLLMRGNHHADRFTRTSFPYNGPNTILPQPEDGTKMSPFSNHFLS